MVRTNELSYIDSLIMVIWKCDKLNWANTSIQSHSFEVCVFFLKTSCGFPCAVFSVRYDFYRSFAFFYQSSTYSDISFAIYVLYRTNKILFSLCIHRPIFDAIDLFYYDCDCDWECVISRAVDSILLCFYAEAIHYHWLSFICLAHFNRRRTIASISIHCWYCFWYLIALNYSPNHQRTIWFRSFL